MNKKKPDKNETFLHDLINHTHSLLLFLGQKKRTGSLAANEIDQLISEIKLMQNFIKDEWNYQHRDVSSTDVDADLVEIFKISQSLLTVYFSQDLVAVTTNLDQVVLNQTKDFKINSVLFFRILSNVVKNISEAGPTKVEISFFIDETGILKIETKNDFKPKVKAIDRNCQPIGMFSIKSLVESVGGSFEVNFNETWWTNSISIPLLTSANKPFKVA
jgi:hypothetical protein